MGKNLRKERPSFEIKGQPGTSEINSIVRKYTPQGENDLIVTPWVNNHLLIADPKEEYQLPR